MFTQLAALSDNLQNGHAYTETSGVQEHLYNPVSDVTQMGAGCGGEGAEDRHGPPMRRNTRREGMQQGWREPSGKYCQIILLSITQRENTTQVVLLQNSFNNLIIPVYILQVIWLAAMLDGRRDHPQDLVQGERVEKILRVGLTDYRMSRCSSRSF